EEEGDGEGGGKKEPQCERTHQSPRDLSGQLHFVSLIVMAGPRRRRGPLKARPAEGASPGHPRNAFAAKKDVDGRNKCGHDD
ncbi:MAG: hypothetical protein HY246_25655, partial [Proteobacteria bacterium]|nr:hypothetical protein [Pseudomonadota bacterium]